MEVPNRIWAIFCLPSSLNQHLSFTPYLNERACWLLKQESGESRWQSIIFAMHRFFYLLFVIKSWTLMYQPWLPFWTLHLISPGMETYHFMSVCSMTCSLIFLTQLYSTVTLVLSLLSVHMFELHSSWPCFAFPLSKVWSSPIWLGIPVIPACKRLRQHFCSRSSCNTQQNPVPKR